MSGRTEVVTADAPAPAGPYSQAVVAGGFVFLAGQTPRTPAGERLLDAPLDVQVTQVLDNLARVAEAAGSSLRDAVKVTIYIRPGVDMAVLNAIYSRYFTAPLPARTTIVSDLAIGALEIDVTLWPDPSRVVDPDPAA